MSVAENDINNDRDEEVTLLIDTPNSSEEQTIQELRSEIVDGYRIRVLDANARSRGRAEFEITFLRQ